VAHKQLSQAVFVPRSVDPCKFLEAPFPGLRDAPRMFEVSLTFCPK
jgi:hypothetical protein